MEMLTDIIVGLIVALLKMFFEWLFKKNDVPSEPNKAIFMQRVQKKWYLGKRRKELAEKVWGKAVARYETAAVQVAFKDGKHDEVLSVVFSNLKDAVMDEVEA
jgi:hypothetical protein